ncbi:MULTISPECIES: hypothetical protein [Curvibacter]|jgi:hypothetical protein|uniref:hypothetical protein n=1 Tax=Curvibacter TaxID=281915 RepID=UPI00036B97F9|nr:MULTISPECIES: hypothetical protein [Curvibacter]
MSSFVHTPHSFHHAGVARAEKAAETLRDASRQFDGPRGTATLLLAAVVAALVVAANQVIDTWSDGHLLAAWIGLWTVAFAALALLATPIRRASVGLRAGLASWKRARHEAAEDRKLWSLALTDARVMADISRAMSRDAARDVRGYF